MPQLIIDGRVYKSVPPLYGITKGGSGKDREKVVKYFVDRLEYNDYVLKLFAKNNTIYDINKKKLSFEESSRLLFKNSEYVYDMDVVCRRYAINPQLLELILVIIHEYMNTSKFDSVLKKIIEKEYRFLKVRKEHDINIIEGLVDSKYQTIILNQQFFRDIETVLYHVHDNSDMDFIVNEEKMGLYKLMQMFQASSPKGLIRYKGLGEMNPDQLAESTLHPDSPNRVLIQYTMESAEEYIAQIRILESDKSKLLGDNKGSRLDMIG